MTEDEIKELEKKVNKLKFAVSQKAAELHDLIEDRLLQEWKDIPAFAEEAYNACKAWAEKSAELKKAQKD